MHFELIDDVLSFFVNYDMYVYKEASVEPEMETVVHDMKMKG